MELRSFSVVVILLISNYENVFSISNIFNNYLKHVYKVEQSAFRKSQDILFFKKLLKGWCILTV